MTTVFQNYLITFELTMNFTHRYEKCFLISYVTLGGNKVHIFINIFLSLRLYEEKCIYRLNDALYACINSYFCLFIFRHNFTKTKQYVTQPISWKRPPKIDFTISIKFYIVYTIKFLCNSPKIT